MMLKLKRMDLIDLYIGLKQVKNKKMEVLKEKNGNKIVVIMENGLIIKNMDLVFKSMAIKINMKEVGFKI